MQRKGSGCIRDVRRKGCLAHVDADTYHQPRRAAVGEQGGLGQNAAELFAVQHHIVAPLDAAVRVAEALNSPAHGHRRQRRHGEQLPGRAVLPQGGKIQAALR